MTDQTALSDQAYAAADAALELLAGSVDRLPQLDRRLLRTMFAYGWVEGRSAGGAEAQAVIRRTLELWVSE